MTPRGCEYCNGLMWEQHEISAGHHEVCAIKANQCLNNGGHYWDSPPPGFQYKCDHCGARGVKNLPAVDEKRVEDYLLVDKKDANNLDWATALDREQHASGWAARDV